MEEQPVTDPVISEPPESREVQAPLTNTDWGLVTMAIIYNFLILLFATLWVFTNNFSSLKSGLTTIAGLSINESVTYSLFFAGMLGGSSYCLRSIYLQLALIVKPRVATEPPPADFNIRIWLFWYLFRPWQSGVLALVILCLVNANLLTAKAMTPDNLKSLYSLIAVGFLTGLGTHEVIQKIQEIIAVVFARSNAGQAKNGTP